MDTVTLFPPSYSQTAVIKKGHMPAFTGYRGPVAVSGLTHKLIKFLIWLNILFIAIRSSGLLVGLKKTSELRKLRDQYRNNLVLKKYRRVNKKYYYNYNAPGWPSKAFNRYILHLVNKTPDTPSTLHTLIFAITKKCGFKCEHCCEWENLNKAERLEKDDIVEIVHRFHGMGISQLQLSGGEPLNRFNDILFLLDNIPRDVECWIYTTGYQLTAEKALLLKEHGLTGITLSIDDHDPLRHDRFRGKEGSFHRAMLACKYAVDAGLVVTFSICATKSFISMENMQAYADLAKKQRVSFIQVLEPKAVGHYAGMDVTLQPEHLCILEKFFEMMNYDKAYSSYPIVAYHGYYSRRIGCSGSGKDYLYVDTDGEVHNCPFCQRKLFSALGEGLKEKVRLMRENGCAVFSERKNQNAYTPN